MSGILKPLVTSSRATTQKPVNADMIITYAKLSVVNVNNSPAQWSLVFAIDTENFVKEIVWKYASEADVDDDIIWLDANLATATA